MAYLKRPYEPFVVHGEGDFSVLGLRGRQNGEFWRVGTAALNRMEPVYTQADTDPMPFKDHLVELLRTDRREGKLEEVVGLLVSNRVALYLLLEGALDESAFLSLAVCEEDVCDSIATAPVQLEEFAIPLIIYPEWAVNPYTAYTIDEYDDMV